VHLIALGYPMTLTPAQQKD